MEILNLVLSIVALVLAILAYQKAGGVAGLRKQIDQVASSGELRKSIEVLTAATQSLRERTAEAIGRLEAALRRKEEAKPEEERPPEEPEETAEEKPSKEEKEKTE